MQIVINPRNNNDMMCLIDDSRLGLIADFRAIGLEVRPCHNCPSCKGSGLQIDDVSAYVPGYVAPETRETLNRAKTKQEAGK